MEEITFFDEIDNGKPATSLILIPKPKEEPIVVTVSIKIVFQQQIVLEGLLHLHIGPAKIATLEVSINHIFSPHYSLFLLF